MICVASHLVQEKHLDSSALRSTYVPIVCILQRACHRLALVFIVVARWYMDVDVIYFTSIVLCTTLMVNRLEVPRKKQKTKKDQEKITRPLGKFTPYAYASNHSHSKMLVAGAEQ